MRHRFTLRESESVPAHVHKRGHLPKHGEGRDIFERLYAVRLDRLRQSPECRAVLKGVDPASAMPAF